MGSEGSYRVKNVGDVMEALKNCKYVNEIPIVTYDGFSERFISKVQLANVEGQVCVMLHLESIGGYQGK